MHSIERYGIVALLFLVVTVVAVLMWDGNKEKKEAEVPGQAPVAVAASPGSGGTGSGGTATPADDARRLSLVAESRPGPLQRHPRAEGSALEAPGVDPAQGGTPLSEAADEGAPLTLEAQAPREEPAPEQVIGLKADAPALPAAAAARAYAVRPGDTLSEIAQHELGSSRRWPELVAANPGLDPGKLRVGQSIRIPGGQAAGVRSAAVDAVPPKKGADSKATLASGKTWRVGKGENLWRIAERALGDGKRWGEIASLNPKVDPDKLLLGQVLVLPASARTPAATPDKKESTQKSAPKLASNAPKAKPEAKPKSAAVVVASASRPEGNARRGGKVK